MDEISSLRLTQQSGVGKILLVSLLCLSFAGCYESDREVITSEAAEALPYKSNTVDLKEDGKLWLSKAAGNDYSFRHTKSDDPQPRTGIIRGIRIKRDLYAVQMKYDDPFSYDIVFCKIHSGNFELVEPKSDAAIQDLARQDKVSFTGLSGKLSGDPANTLKFIRDHKRIEFKKFKG